jgi:hypothetical protein
MTDTNLDTRLNDTNKLIRKLGTQSASSALAKPMAAITIAQARADGILTDDSGEACYTVYLEGRKSILSKNALGAGEDDSTSFKANVSKFTQILKATGLVAAGIDFVDVINTATNERENLAKSGEKVKPAFDAYVDLARAQLKEPTVQLTEEQITAIVRKKESAEKEIVDKLIAAYKTARKLGDEFPCGPMADVVDGYKKAIEEAGGEVPAIGKEEKQAAEVTAFLASRGMVAALKPAAVTQ